MSGAIRTFQRRFPAARRMACLPVTSACLCGDHQWSLSGRAVAAVSGVGVFPSVGSASVSFDCHREDKGVMFK